MTVRTFVLWVLVVGVLTFILAVLPLSQPRQAEGAEALRDPAARPDVGVGPPGGMQYAGLCATCGHDASGHALCARCGEAPYCPRDAALCGYSGVCEQCRADHMVMVPHDVCRDHGLACGSVARGWFGIVYWHCGVPGCGRWRLGGGLDFSSWGE